MQKYPDIYVAGDIMTHGSQLARQEECEKINNAKLNMTYFSPMLEKSINDKSNMTEEENNHLAEKIVKEDVERLFNCNTVVLCPEQSAIGTMCETAILYGWKYLTDKLFQTQVELLDEMQPENNKESIDKFKVAAYDKMCDILSKMELKQNYFHYSDIRTNHLNEKDWRRSFSINQFLYGCILYAASDGILHNNFDEVIEILKKENNCE